MSTAAKEKTERKNLAKGFQPLGDRVFVTYTEELDRTSGGIYVPDSAKEKPQQGTVIAVGNGKANDDGKVVPLDVKTGDRILFGKYAGQEIKLDGQEYFIMKEDDVLAVIEGRPKQTASVPGGTSTILKKKKK